MSDTLDQSVTLADTGDRAVTLEYAPRLAWHEQRRWRRTVLRLSLGLLLVAAAAGAVRPVKHRLRLLSLERQCATMPAAMSVVFCDKLNSGPTVSPPNASAIREFGEATDRYAFLFRRANAVFAQTLRCPDGQERTILACILVGDDRGCCFEATNTVYVLDFQSVPKLSAMGGLDSRKVKQRALVYRVPIAESGLRIQTPTIDPQDSAHMTLEMDTQSGPVAINARIDNDGILNFDLRGLDPELWYLNR